MATLSVGLVFAWWHKMASVAPVPTGQGSQRSAHVEKHWGSQRAQNSCREVSATTGKDDTFVWFTNVTLLPDDDLRVKCLHLGCAKTSFPEENR